ncbi:IclR family transcriptional regulator [Phyllobacterium sp. YR531]|uniref:IclR family transcriptional regulator n=1 Tax=Phyllobacterium sp. YR531 TaxID=1144343 RepID=UPI00026FCCBA|nr:IclR family transcriptional regulator [Phyllobacterium sp. YR531]EJM99500.1 beta-ketoadipate pathway transcriptional regulator, PcaR/PcaU/PobR family [Phyllobacterium sp. YR531]
MRETDFISGFAKGLRVIEAFGEATPRLSITDVSTITGLERATARRCLLTLSKLGYAHYDGKFFTLTSRVLRLGHAYLSATPLPRIVQPFLDRLSEATGESASVSVLDGNEVVYIARAAQRRVMSINLSPGSRLPAYCASMGRVLLATLPGQQARNILETTDLKANTQHTLTNIEELLNELQHVREQGYAIVDQELEMGLRSIAIPLIGANGSTVAALNVGTQAVRTELTEMVGRYLPIMRETQAALRLVLL